MGNRKIDSLSTKSRNWSGSYSYSFEAHNEQGQLRTDCIGNTGLQYMEEPLALNRDSISLPAWDAVKRAWEDTVQARWRACVAAPDSVVLAVTLVFHDNDIIEEEDGTRHYKGLHAQICVHTVSTTKGAVMTALGLPQDAGGVGNLNHCSNTVASYRYLLHISKEAVDAGKHIYDENLLVVLSSDYKKYNVAWARAQMEESDVALRKQKERAQKNTSKLRDKLLMDVMCGAITRAEAQAIYMNTDGLGITKYFDDLARFDKADSEYLKRVTEFYANSENHFCRLFVLLTGDGGNGKSTVAQLIAEHLADKRGVFSSVARASTVFDPFQGYNGQRVAVFDEMRGRSWGRTDKDQFLLAFDPMRINQQSARYHNVHFCAPYVLATTTETVAEFTDNMVMASITPDNPYKERMKFWYESGGTRDDRDGAYCPFWSDFRTGSKYNGPDSHKYSDKVEYYKGTPLDDLWQIRRRIAIIINCKKIDESHLELNFYCRQDAPPAGFHARYMFTTDELYLPCGSIEYNLRDSKSVDVLMDYFKSVEKTYYDINGYRSRPETMVPCSAQALLGAAVPSGNSSETTQEE